MRRSFRMARLALVVALAGVLLAIYLGWRGIDLSAYRPELVASVQAATGRAFAIGDDLDIGFNNGLVIRASDLSLGNADWGSRPDMLTAGRAEARLALLPLLRGRLEIRHIGLEQVDLLLETDASGQGNWVLGAGDSGSGANGFEVRSVAIRSGNIAWRSGETPGAAPVQLAKLDVLARQRGDRLDVSAGAEVAGQQVTLSGSTTAPHQWSDGSPIAVSVRLDTGRGELSVEGSITPSRPGLAAALRFSARDLDTQGLGEIAGKTLPGLPPMQVAADVALSPADWRIENLDLKAGGGTLQGGLTWSTGTGRPNLSANLVADSLDIDQLFALQTGGTSSGSPTAAAQRIFSAEPIGLRRLGSFDAVASLRGRQVKLFGQALDAMSLSATLRDTRLHIDTLDATIEGGGKVTGSASLAVGAADPDWSLDVSMVGVPASTLLGEPLMQARAELTLKLATRGDSPHEMAAHLAGDARLVIGKGRARLKTIDALVGGLSTVTGQLLERGTDDAQLNCVIGDFVVDEGIATPRILLIDSAASTVRGDGSIDLGRELIDITFTPRPKKPTLTVAVPVHVRGNLRAPSFTPDQKASLTKLIGVAGAFIYPPAAIAALGDLGSSNTDCSQLLQTGASTKQPDSTTERVTKGVEDAARSISRGLKGLLGQ